MCCQEIIGFVWLAQKVERAAGAVGDIASRGPLIIGHCEWTVRISRDLPELLLG